MGKLEAYIVVMSGLMLVFYFTGLLQLQPEECTLSQPANALLCFLLSPEDLPESDVVKNKILVAIAGVLGVAIVIGAFFTGQVELALFSAPALALLTLLWGFLGVFNVMKDANPVIAILIFAPLLILLPIGLLRAQKKQQEK